MKEAIVKGIDLKIFDAVWGVAGAREQMVPLQKLVEHDAIEQTPESYSQEEAW
jgi:hypothetical protein